MPGDPEVRYHRHLVGVVFDDSTSGITINRILQRYQATVVGGLPQYGTSGAYILQLPDTVTTYEGLQGLINTISGESGVDFAFGTTWRGKVVFRSRGERPDWPLLSALPVLDTTKLVTLPNDTTLMYRTELVIAFDEGISDATKQSILKSFGFTVIGVTAAGRFFVRFTDRGESYEAYHAFVDSVRARPGIRNVELINFTPLQEENFSRYPDESQH